MLRLSEMDKLAVGVCSVGRDPVKTQFTEFERGVVKYFFLSNQKRAPADKRARFRPDAGLLRSMPADW